MTPKSLLCIALFFNLTVIYCQSDLTVRPNNNGFQYGLSIKATLELGFTNQTPNPVYRITANAGVASNFISASFHPSINTEIQMYNGGLGSRNKRGFLNSFTMDWITAFTITGGWTNQANSNHAIDYSNKNVPLYYFADFVAPALKNPFRQSISIGTNIILSTDRGKTSQRVGFLNLHADNLQVSYYNDGGNPIAPTHLGDLRDRYYTGGVVLSYHRKRQSDTDLFEVSFHKFTGYTRNAFELSNKMYLGYMDYHDTEQKYYNKSMYSFTISDLTRKVGVSVKAYNHLKADIQHKIHWGLFNTYHMVKYPSYWSVSGYFYQSSNNTGIQ